jgi:hypothetical protein
MLRGIRARTLLILAEPATSYLQESMMAPRIACVDDIEVVRVAGNHHLHLEVPEQVFATIAQFCASPASGRGRAQRGWGKSE